MGVWFHEIQKMTAALAGPLFLGAGTKIAYDLLLYFSFRRIKPPEEKHTA